MLLSPVFAPPADAREAMPDEELPVHFSADEMTYDQDLGVITAKGSVEVSYGERVLLANTISYNQKADLVTASGDIKLLEPTGEVIFAQFIELSGDLKEGVVEDFRMILADGARIAAAGGRRYRDERTEMNKAVYSPCNLCAEDPSRPPLWQVKAVRVTHDKKEQVIEYEDAWLEIAGVPVAYTPYLQHADPTVGRKTGLLAPSVGGSSDLGLIAEMPVYINIAPNMDATVTPKYSETEGPALAGEFRGVFDRSEFEFKGSLTQDSSDQVRGHILTEGQFDIDETWRWGFDINRATDDTYMRRFGYGSFNTLTSNVYAEGFRQRNYAAVNAYAFQSQSTTDDPGDTPLVLPMAEYHHVGQPDFVGGRASLDLGLLALTRNEGTDTRRLSLNAGWKLPHVSEYGSVYTLSTDLQANLYHVNGLDRSGNKEKYTGLSHRLHPQMAMEWRHPFVREEGSSSVYQMLEPKVAVVVSPYAGSSDKIPNEDSQEFEFDDTNLFTTNRFSGIDRIEGGPRLNYGLKWGLFGRGGGNTVLTVGQSYRLKADDTFSEGSGLEDNFSDIVGSLHIDPGRYVNLFYRTRLDKDDLSIKRNEVNLTAGTNAFRFNSNYIFFDRQQGSEFATREQLSLAATTKLTRYWRTSVSGLRDLSDDEMRSIGLGLTYEDECLTFDTRATRTFYHDGDLQPTDAILFTLTFKTLGEVHSGASQSH